MMKDSLADAPRTHPPRSMVTSAGRGPRLAVRPARPGPVPPAAAPQGRCDPEHGSRGFPGVEVTDGQLVQRVLDGDAKAFDALVDRHYAVCLRFADRLIGQRADAEEAVQDTFLRAYRALGRYRDRQKFRSWLFRILVNRCRTYARRDRRRRIMEEHEQIATLHAVASEPEPAGELDPRLRTALARLPRPQREALLLKHVDELTYEEMAEITGARVSALKMRVKRGLASLARSLENHHGP